MFAAIAAVPLKMRTKFLKFRGRSSARIATMMRLSPATIAVKDFCTVTRCRTKISPFARTVTTTLLHDNDVYWLGDYPYCRDCYDDETEDNFIHDYYYKPTPIFYKCSDEEKFS